MPPLYACPLCDNPLTREEYRKQLCPACRRDFSGKQHGSPPVTGPTPGRRPPPIPQPEAEEPPAVVVAVPGPKLPPIPKAPPRLRAAPWGTVRAGLALASIGSLLMVVFFGLLYLVSPDLRSVRADAGGPSYVAMQWRGLLAQGLYASGAVLLAGACLCVAAPTAATRSWAIAALACMVLALTAYFLTGFASAANTDYLNPPRAFHQMPAFPPAAEPPWKAGHFYALGWTAAIAMILADAFFALLLFFIAWHFRWTALAWVVLGYLGVSVLFQVVRAVVLANLAGPGVGLMWLLGVRRAEVIYIFGLVLTVWWVVLVFLVRRAVTVALRDSRAVA